jgi:hypothetical protein
MEAGVSSGAVHIRRTGAGTREGGEAGGSRGDLRRRGEGGNQDLRRLAHEMFEATCIATRMTRAGPPTLQVPGRFPGSAARHKLPSLLP